MLSIAEAFTPKKRYFEVEYIYTLCLYSVNPKQWVSEGSST